MINPITTDLIHILQPRTQNVTTGRRSENIVSPFGNILTEAFHNVNLTNADSRASALELLIGESDDISGMLIDAQKAELALNLALQIRNRFIDAYNELMRMTM